MVGQTLVELLEAPTSQHLMITMHLLMNMVLYLINKSDPYDKNGSLIISKNVATC